MAPDLPSIEGAGPTIRGWLRGPSSGTPPLSPFATAEHRPGAAPTLGRLGSLEVRLARTRKEVRRAQRLRYKVFFKEGRAVARPAARLARRDMDPFDRLCDHLLVLDHAVVPKPFRKPSPKVVGTYRLLRRSVAEAHGGFYSSGEFDLAPLLRAHPGVNILELGRSCVARPYRSRKTIDLLWQGIWACVRAWQAEVLIGCASLDGTDVSVLGPQLGYLHRHAPAAPGWQARARPGRGVAIGSLGPSAGPDRAALKALPPLVKAYLRLGATFGDEAVLDPVFGTTDVFVVLPVGAIDPRYIERFGASGAGASAASPSR